MNKLTTINTIKKAAPLALLAVVLSGSAFAGPGKGKGDRPKGPKLSLDVFTLCTLDDSYYQDPVLNVTTTITDVSDDNGTGDSVVISKTAQAAAKARGRLQLIGSPTPLMSAGGDTYTAQLHLCDEGLSPDDRAVTAVGLVKVMDGDNVAEFASQCENVFVDVNEDGIDDDGIDQSNIDLDKYSIYCPTW